MNGSLVTEVPEIRSYVLRIAEAMADWEKADDVDDRVGAQRRVWDLEKYLGRCVYDHAERLGLWP